MKKKIGGVLIGIGGIGVMGFAVIILLSLLGIDPPTVGIIGGADTPTMLTLISAVFAEYITTAFVYLCAFAVCLLLIFAGCLCIASDTE